jgi:hypothetical protein
LPGQHRGWEADQAEQPRTGVELAGEVPGEHAAHQGDPHHDAGGGAYGSDVAAAPGTPVGRGEAAGLSYQWSARLSSLI